MVKTAQTASFPSAAVTQNDIGRFTNFEGTALTAEALIGDTTLDVGDVSELEVGNWLYALSRTGPLVMKVSAVDAVNKRVTVTRGQDGTTDVDLAEGTRVFASVPAAALNKIAVELVAIESVLTGASSLLHGLTIEATSGAEVPLTLLLHDEVTDFASSKEKFISFKRETGGVTSEVGSIVYDYANDQLELHNFDLDVATGVFQVGSTTVFENDRDLAVNLVPNATRTLDLGSTTRYFDDLYAARVLGMVDVRAYGAVGDGVTDDYAAFAAAAAALPASGGVIYVPPGTYALGTAFQIGTGITLQGAGRNSTTIKRLAAMAAGATVPIAASYVVIRDITVDNNSQAQDGVKWTGGNNGGIYGCRVINVGAGGYALTLSAASSNLIDDVLALNVDRALLITNISNAVTIRKFDFSTTSTTAASVVINGCTSVRWYDGILEHKFTAITTQNGANDIDLYGCYVEGIGTAAAPGLDLGGGGSASWGFRMFGGYVTNNFDTTVATVRINDLAYDALFEGVLFNKEVATTTEHIRIADAPSRAGPVSIKDCQFRNSIAYNAINATGDMRHIHIENVRDVGTGTGTLALRGTDITVRGTDMNVSIDAASERVHLEHVRGTITDASAKATRYQCNDKRFAMGTTAAASALLHFIERDSASVSTMILDNAAASSRGAAIAFRQSGVTRGVVGVQGNIEGDTDSGFGVFSEAALLLYSGGNATTPTVTLTATNAFQLNGTTLFESDRDIAVSLTPNADNALTNGTSTRRWSNVYAATVEFNGFMLVSSTSVTDGALIDSPSLVLRAKYDSDPAAGVTSATRDANIYHDITTGGVSPASRFLFDIAGTAYALLTDTGRLSVGVSPANPGSAGTFVESVSASTATLLLDNTAASSRGAGIILRQGGSQRGLIAVQGLIEGNTNAGIGIFSEGVLNFYAGGSGSATGAFTAAGDFQVAGTTLFEADRDIAVNLTPNTDNTLTDGTAARRWASSHSVLFDVRAAASDANPTARLSTNALSLGVNSADALSVMLTAGAANRLDLATGDSFNIVLGSLLMAGTALFESDRDLAMSLIPNADISLDLGSPTRRFRSSHLGSIRPGVGAKSANYTITDTDGITFIPVTTGAGTVTMTLPSAATVRMLIFKKVDNTAGTMTIARAGTDLIDGATSQSTSTYLGAFMMVSDGVSTWSLF